MKKWYATVNGNDDQLQPKIKIGVVKSDEGYELVASNGDDVSVGKESSLEIALDSIRLKWGQWTTFAWIG